MKNLVLVPFVLSICASFCAGCGSAPIRATLIGQEKNIWIDEAGGLGLAYCVSNGDGKRPEPICYSARRHHGSSGSDDSLHIVPLTPVPYPPAPPLEKPPLLLSPTSPSEAPK